MTIIPYTVSITFYFIQFGVLDVRYTQTQILSIKDNENVNIEMIELSNNMGRNCCRFQDVSLTQVSCTTTINNNKMKVLSSSWPDERIYALRMLASSR